MAATGSDSSFPLFTFLPPELRIQIWRDALSGDDPPALCPYRKECWLEGPPHFGRVDYELRPELFDHVRVKIPIASVNQEAREIAIAWLPKKGIKVQFHEERKCHIFLRPFDQHRDIVYIRPSIVEDANNHFWGGFTPVDAANQAGSVGLAFFRFAITEQLFREEIAELLRDTICCFGGSPEIFVIADPQPKFGNETSSKVQPRWELEDLDGEMAFALNEKTDKMEVKFGPRLHNNTFQRVHAMIWVVNEAIEEMRPAVFLLAKIRLMGAVRR